MRVGSLFSGAGGLDLAVGGQVLWWADNWKPAATVMAARFPTAAPLGDVTAVEWAHAPAVDVLTAGFPCQPFSQAGKWKGLDDDRHLWPHLAGAIRVLGPRWVVLENVPGFVPVGLAGAVGDLSEMGYSVRWTTVRASDAGACHQRERLFVVADSHADGYGPWPIPGAVGSVDDAAGGEAPEQQRARAQSGTGSAGGVAWGEYQEAIRRWEHVTGRGAPAPVIEHEGQPRLSPRFVEWQMGFPAGWVTDVLPYDSALRVLGNAVVPQQARHALGLLAAGVEVAA